MSLLPSRNSHNSVFAVCSAHPNTCGNSQTHIMSVEKIAETFEITKKGLKFENKYLSTFSEKKMLLNFFMQKFNYLPNIQICLTCVDYNVINSKVYCNLTKNQIKPSDMKYDCKSFERKDFYYNG